MKNLLKKVQLLPVAAMIIGAALAFTQSAFKNAEMHRAGEAWFSYNSTSQATADLQNPENYSFLGENQPACNSGNKRCAVQAQPSSTNPNQPDLSTMIAEVKKP